jgi:polyribonucleotide nucleotidyltransferase
MAELKVFKTSLSGRDLIIETGLLAQQAQGAVSVRYGDSMVLVTACVSEGLREGVDFLPLTVDYEERLYAAGKIPGGFIRREGRPSEDATLASRMIDRIIRPLFPKGFRHETQIIVTVLSADLENDPDILAVIGASAALTISKIPFKGPVGAVRVGFIGDQMVLNPTMPQLTDSQLDIVVASTRGDIAMIEAGAREIPRDRLVEAINLAHEANQAIIKLQDEMAQVLGQPKMEFKPIELGAELIAAVSAEIGLSLRQIIQGSQKTEREKALDKAHDGLLAKLKDKFAETEINAAYDAQLKRTVREIILDTNAHVDGRKADEIRPISCKVGLLPRTHGSGFFQRGATQVLTITTLGSKGEQQMLDGLGIDETKRFMHHYNFPPFSVGEVRRVGSPGRREIGHGALAERALSNVIPSEEEFPYTIRLVSEVLSSNGSSSMGSVCASSLSLMDAGVPIKSPVAGIAMGLVLGDDGRRVILTDIEGMEDANGDMDFKIAGTDAGINALQLDIKKPGLSTTLLAEALQQGVEGYRFVLAKIKETIQSSRPEMSKFAPRVYTIQIDPGKIGTVIGPGGKTIRGIIEKCKVTIDVEDTGKVHIGATEEASANAAIKIIEDLTKDVVVGSVYTGKVTRILNFGAMVELFPGKEGLVHVSELEDYRVERVEDVVKVGDEIMVKVIELDRQGRVNLSRKAVFENKDRPAGEAGQPPRPQTPYRRPDSGPPRRGGPPRGPQPAGR